jgi:hypothetical protein
MAVQLIRFAVRGTTGPAPSKKFAGKTTGELAGL